jgi:hypothetical protein
MAPLGADSTMTLVIWTGNMAPFLASFLSSLFAQSHASLFPPHAGTQIDANCGIVYTKQQNTT